MEIYAVLCSHCGKPPSLANGNKRNFKCEYCDTWNFIIKPIDPKDTTGLNSEAGILFKAGNINDARIRWTKAADAGSEDGEAYLGLCWCDYADRINSLTAFVKDIRKSITSLGYIPANEYDVINIQANQLRNTAQQHIRNLGFNIKSAHYILAKQYADKSDFNNLNKEINDLHETINNVLQAIDLEVAKMATEAKHERNRQVKKANAERRAKKLKSAIKWCFLKFFKMLVTFAAYYAIWWALITFIEVEIPFPVVIIAVIISGLLWKNKKRY